MLVRYRGLVCGMERFYAVSRAYYLSLSMYLQDRVMPLPIKGLPIKGLPTIEPLD